MIFYCGASWNSKARIGDSSRGNEAGSRVPPSQTCGIPFPLPPCPSPAMQQCNSCMAWAQCGHKAAAEGDCSMLDITGNKCFSFLSPPRDKAQSQDSSEGFNTEMGGPQAGAFPWGIHQVQGCSALLKLSILFPSILCHS